MPAETPKPTTPRQDRSEQELRQIAIDFQENKIFCSQHIHPNERDSMIPSVFMVINFMDADARKKLIDENVVVFFEYLTEAGPMSVNGYPIFFSMRSFTSSEWKTILPMIEELQTAKEAFLKGSKPATDGNKE